jgi:hypothetical protein
MPTMTDAELRAAMKLIAAVNGLTLSDDRLTTDLAQYKALLSSTDRIQRVELPLEAEPAVRVRLDRGVRGD